MESTERAQVRLILEHERLSVQRVFQEKLQALYGEHAAIGRPQSGATAKAGMRIVEELGEDFVKTSVDQVATVAMDTDAFAMIVEETESLFRVFRGEVDGLINLATGNQGGDPGHRSIADAVHGLFRDAHKRTMRQLEIHRFTFTKPNTRKLKEGEQDHKEAAHPRPSSVKSERTKAGRLPADWWDDLWIEMFRQIYLGDLKPSSQADIVKAMQQWLSDRDVEAADSTLKPRARKLLQMLQETDD